VPESVRKTLVAYQENPRLSLRERDILERLAAYPAMRDVWEKLKRANPDADPGFVVHWVSRYSSDDVLARGLAKPFHKMRKDELGKHLCEHPREPTPAEVAGCVEFLLGDLETVRPVAEVTWPDNWKGNPDITFEGVLGHLRELGSFLRRIAPLWAVLYEGLPSIKHKNAPNARVAFFMLALAARLSALYGRPCHEIVATLADVAFDVEDGTSADALRKRRERQRKRA
jgi:hypothetical protein